MPSSPPPSPLRRQFHLETVYSEHFSSEDTGAFVHNIPPAHKPIAQPLQPAQATRSGPIAPSKVRKARKANSASTGKPILFWVNTDQQSASVGINEETLKRIRSHVMLEHNRIKRLNNANLFSLNSSSNDALQTSQGTTGTEEAAGPYFPPLESAAFSSTDRQRSSGVIEQARLKQELVPSKVVDFLAMSESSV